MLPEMQLAVIAAVPFILVLFFRSNAAIVYLSVCVGVVLQNVFGPDAHMILDAIVPRGSSLYGQGLDIFLVGAPALAATLLLRKKAKGFKFIMGIVPAVCAGLIIALSTVQYVSPLGRQAIYRTVFWKNLSEFKGPVVLLGTISSLALLKPSPKHDESSKKHHK